MGKWPFFAIESVDHSSKEAGKMEGFNFFSANPNAYSTNPQTGVYVR